MVGNWRYRKGRAREYELARQFNKRGYIVLRTAGSRGFADLICIHKEKKIIRFIQSKAGEFSQSQKNVLEKEYSWVSDLFACEYRVIGDKERYSTK